MTRLKRYGVVECLCILVISMFGIIARAIESFEIITICVFALFILSTSYCLHNIKKRYTLMFFNFSIFLFLIGRPLFRVLGFGDDVEWYDYGNDYSLEAISLVFLSLLCLVVGQIIGENFFYKRSITRYKYPPNVIARIRSYSEFFFYVCAIFKGIVELERLVYMIGKNYTEVYVGFSSRLPFFIHGIAGFMVYFFCIYLSTFPDKKNVLKKFVIYIGLSIPWLIIGARSSFVSSLAFVSVYYCLRQSTDVGGSWINDKEKRIALIFLPVVIIGLGAFNYVRDNNTDFELAGLSIIIDFIIKQGVTFNTVCLGIENADDIKGLGEKLYVFGPFYDYVKYGVLGQLLFNNSGLPNGNSLEMIRYGNSMAHDLSYITRGDYLEGHGFGSSYILELFFEYGYIGVVFFNILLGYIFSIVNRMALNGILYHTIELIIFTSLFLLPRSGLSEPVTFIIKYQFWVCLSSVFLLAYRKGKGFEKNFAC